MPINNVTDFTTGSSPYPTEHSLSSRRKALESRLWLFLEVLQLSARVARVSKLDVHHVSPRSPSWFSHLIDTVTISHYSLSKAVSSISNSVWGFSSASSKISWQSSNGHLKRRTELGWTSWTFPLTSKSSNSWSQVLTSNMGMDQYRLLIPFLGGWTSIYQLFWCSCHIIKPCPCQSAAFGLHLAPAVWDRGLSISDCDKWIQMARKWQLASS